MASTEPRAGFRPPWALNVDSDDSTDATPVTGDAETLDEGSPDALRVTAGTAPVAAEATPVPSPGLSTPTKFQVDLARAMRAAAETARQESMERLAAESQVRIEAIRARSSGVATELRQRADDDIAEIRDWSKAELARIRSETDAKITDRKSWLAQEIEAHEESIEVLVSAVTSRVSAFEADLAAFFGRMAEEDDPTRIAVLAQALPDVPSLDDGAVIEAVGSAAATTTPTVAVDPAAEEPAIGETSPEVAEVETDVTTGVEAEATAEIETDATAEIETLAGAAATPALVDPWADAPGWGTPVATATTAETGDSDASEPFAAVERRLAALALDAVSAETAAEVEAATDVVAGETDAATVVSAEAETVSDAMAEPESGSTETIPEGPAFDSAASATETLAPSAAGPTDTNVVVDGLISVASIAGFKRNLSRVEGVHAVTVSSGPDGEFVFAVRHEATTVLEDVLPTMPGFGARVIASQAGQISVTAHDPENVSDDVVLDPAGRRS